MIIPEKLDYIKSCCVAIGLTKPYKTEPSEVFGSGFIINSEYMIFSAWHVLDKCYKKYIQSNGGSNTPKNGIQFVAYYVTQGDSTMQILSIPIYKIQPLTLDLPDGYPKEECKYLYYLEYY